MTLLETFFPEINHTSSLFSTPYNLVKSGDSELILEMNVAGLSEEDIDIEVCENVLKVSVNAQDERQYVVRGLAQRSFTKTFSLRDDTQVKSAAVKNGLLSIVLETIVPESKKPKKILLTN
jgi:molecular chaperone IbpA